MEKYNKAEVVTDGDLDLIEEFAELLRLLGLGKDGLEDASVRYQALVMKLPTHASDYLYPWYCLLLALAADMLCHLRGGACFFEEHSPNRLTKVYDRTVYTKYLFEKKATPTLLSSAVIAFLRSARVRFVDLCWHVIEPKKESVVPTGDKEISLWDLLHAIPESDKNFGDCWAIYSDLDLLLAAGKPEWSDVLDGVYGVELGESVVM